jgi:hypothetical protein
MGGLTESNSYSDSERALRWWAEHTFTRGWEFGECIARPDHQRGFNGEEQYVAADLR